MSISRNQLALFFFLFSLFINLMLRYTITIILSDIDPVLVFCLVDTILLLYSN